MKAIFLLIVYGCLSITAGKIDARSAKGQTGLCGIAQVIAVISVALLTQDGWVFTSSGLSLIALDVVFLRWIALRG
jgi:hypothetical protein